MPDLPDYYTQTLIAEAEAARIKGGLDDNKPDDPVVKDIYLATDTHILYVCFLNGEWIGFDASILTQGILTLYANMLGGGFQIKNIADPTADQDAATRAYVLAGLALKLALTGGAMTGDIAMGNNIVSGLKAPTNANDAARKTYVDTLHALCLLLAGGTMSGDLTIKKDTPTLILEGTEENAQKWLISEWVYGASSWFRIWNIETDVTFYISPAGWVEGGGRYSIVDTAADPGHYPTLILETAAVGKDDWRLENDGLDLNIKTDGVGAVTLPAGNRIRITASLTADHTWSGSSAVMTSGAVFTIGQVAYVSATSKVGPALAAGTGTMPAIALATGSIAVDATGEFLLQGFFRDDTWDWTPGGLLYVSEDTAGALTQELPAASGEQVQVVGVAITATIIHFNPSYELVEIS